METMKGKDPRNIKSSTINIAGYFCPFVKENPVVIELPGVSGYYVPVFKTIEMLENAMRYLKVWKYKAQVIGNTTKFYDIITSGGARIVVNPKAYNGMTVWEHLLPMSEGVIIPNSNQ